MTPPVRIFKVILEAVLKSQPYQALVQVAQKILVEDRMKRRGDDTLNPERNKEGRMEGELKKDDQKGDGLRVPVEMCYGRAWGY